MLALSVIGAMIVIMGLGALALRISGWKGYGNRAPAARVHHVSDSPGYGLSSYEEGKRVMRLWPAIMREANQAPTDDAPTGPVTCHDGYCGAWDKS